jgi:hypothetical protein
LHLKLFQHNTDTSSDQGGTAAHAQMSNLIDARNFYLAMEVLAFHDYQRICQRFATTRAIVDKIERETEELQASASWAGDESSFDDLRRSRRHVFCSTPLFHTVHPLLPEYCTAIDRMSDSNKLSSSDEQLAASDH